MSQEYDAYLERQCAEAEAQRHVPSVIRLIAALREHTPVGLKQGKEIVKGFLSGANSPKFENKVQEYMRRLQNKQLKLKRE